MKKRMIGLLLAMSLIIALLPSVVLADTPEAVDADFVNAVHAAVELKPLENRTAWDQYLNAQFFHAVGGDAGQWAPKWNTAYAGYASAWKWSGGAATEAPATGMDKPTDAKAIPYATQAGGVTTYYVWSGEQLLYALIECKSHSGTIKLMCDIDLNGQAGMRWSGIDIGANSLTIESVDEAPRTIYNLCAIGKTTDDGKTYSSLISHITGSFAMRKLSFDHANLCETRLGDDNSYAAAAAIVAHVNSPNAVFDHVTVQNSLFVGCYYVGGIYGRMDGNFGTTAEDKHVRNCASENNICFGNYHVGSLTGSCVQINEISNCYSVGSVVISVGGHSGGLLACSGSIKVIRNCFVDAEVYGNNMTGVFSGAISGSSNTQPCHVISCYSSGFVEGEKNLGGFTGMTSSCTNFYDCYSTALVGMRSSGVCLGGFVGNAYAHKDGGVEAGTPQIRFYNCYAAGEVGSIDTNYGSGNGAVSNAVVDNGSPKQVTAGAVAGFAGYIRPSAATEFEACYYDKQTTAMREWGIGNKNDFANGVVGVMSTGGEDSKNGIGLMNTPGTNGFQGMCGNPTDNLYSFYEAGAYPEEADRWDYSADGHYPELNVFSSATSAQWAGSERTAALVRAYSKASTAGVQLETWDNQLNINTGYLTKVNHDIYVYDTVRDIVNGFLMTSDQVEDWKRIGTADSAVAQGSRVEVHGESYDVLSLKHQNGQYLCDELVTGIEWLEVTTADHGVKATRRLRIIPTAALDAGESKVITFDGSEDTSLYDHSDDVKLLYSTAARMANGIAAPGNTNDVTTGIFPDQGGEVSEGFSANALTENQRVYGAGGRGMEDATTINPQNDKYKNVSVGFMGMAGENAEDSLLYTYIYEVDHIGDMDGEIIVGDALDLDANNAGQVGNYAAQFNGYDRLPNADKQYLITYAWQLKDGRVLMDAKLLRTAKAPFSVELHVWKDQIGGTLYDGAMVYAGDMLHTYTDADLKDIGEKLYTEVNAHTEAAVAWKLQNAGDAIKQVKVTLDFSGEKYPAEVSNLAEGITIPFTFYRIVYRQGVYYTISETANRSYTFGQDGDISYLNFALDQKDVPTKQNGIVTGRYVDLNDVECNIRIDVVVEPDTQDPPPPDKRPNVTVEKVSEHYVSEAGNYIFYTLTTKNTGDAVAYGVRIKDYVPEYTHFYSVDKAGKYRIEGDREYVRWFIESLAPSESQTVTFTVTVDECLPGGVAIRNTGLYEVTGNQTDAIPDAQNPGKSTNTTADNPANGITGSATAVLTKVDAVDTATVLAGARFRLYRAQPDGTAQIVGTYSTRSDGKITVSSLPEGEYYWVEIASSASYKLDATPHYFTARNNQTAAVMITNAHSNVPEWLNSADHYAYIIGYKDGSVHPMANITRAEAATIFFRLLTDEVRNRYMTKNNSFSDVKDNDWFCRAVSTMAAMGIINGYPNGTFEPNGSITRAEFATIAARFDANGNSSTACFTDIYGHWAMKKISIAANNGWVLGYADDTFHPNERITRAEAMAMTNRVLQRVPQTSDDLLTDMVNWPDNANEKAWYYLYVQEATNSHYAVKKENGYEMWLGLRPVRDWTAFERD